MRKLLVAVAPLTGEQRERIRKAAERYGLVPVFRDRREDALQEAEDAEIIFGQDRELARRGKSLRWLCTPSAGVDHMIGALASPDALLSNSSGAYGVTIAEHIVMVTLEMMRRQADYTEFVRQRTWRRDLPVRSLCGARITLAGTGDIGQEAARRLRAFRPAVLTGINRRGSNPERLFDEVLPVSSLDQVLPRTDLLILSLPETPETVGLLNADRLALLRENAFLVNVGRGSVLDQRALEDRLRSGLLAGAALDVFQQEPLEESDSLWDCPGLLLTPHVAGNMTLPYTVERIAALFLEDLENYCEGRPLIRQVDPKTGY